jgi:DNA-binding transcriptional regulator YiaG
MKTIDKEIIKQARKDAGLTQSQAADLIYKTWRCWAQWEAGDRRMDLAYYELFMIRCAQRHEAGL